MRLEALSGQPWRFTPLEHRETENRMNRSLLSSTAPLSVMLALVPSGAVANVDLTTGGYAAFRAGLFNASTPTSTGRDFAQEATLTVGTQAVTAFGMAYGTVIRLKSATDSSFSADETSLYAESRFGRIELGDNDGASDVLSIHMPTVGIGQINGKYVEFVPFASRPSGNIKDTGGGIFKPLDSDDATKISYFSPRLAGFQAGFSYAPEADHQSDGEEVQLSVLDGKQRNFIEAGLHYRTEIDAMRFRAAFTATQAWAKTGAGRDDVSAWGAGLQTSYKGVTVGGSFTDNGNSNQFAGGSGDSETAWTLGLTFRKNAWDVGMNYAREDYQRAGGRDNAGGNYSALVLGGSYRITQGLSAGIDLARYVRERANGIDDSGSVIVFETKVSF